MQCMYRSVKTGYISGWYNFMIKRVFNEKEI